MINIHNLDKHIRTCFTSVKINICPFVITAFRHCTANSGGFFLITVKVWLNTFHFYAYHNYASLCCGKLKQNPFVSVWAPYTQSSTLHQSNSKKTCCQLINLKKRFPEIVLSKHCTPTLPRRKTYCESLPRSKNLK